MQYSKPDNFLFWFISFIWVRDSP